MTYEDLQKANESINATLLKNEKTGKEIGYYAEVNQRIKAFRMLYPEGCILTEMVSNEKGVCVFRATIYTSYEMQDYQDRLSYERRILATGYAYEKENSTFINKTSYIENCETSAVGRALAMCGIGIDKSIASAEEVINAVNNQEPTEEEAKAFVFTSGKHKGKTIEEIDEEDEDYLVWWLDNGKNDRIKQMITIVTGMTSTPIPSEEEQTEKLTLLNRMNELVQITKTDYQKMLDHYEVKTNSEMTIEQLKDAINVMEKKNG